VVKNRQEDALQLLVNVDLYCLQASDELGLGQHTILIAFIEQVKELVDCKPFPLFDISGNMLQSLFFYFCSHSLALINALHHGTDLNFLEISLKLVEASDAVHWSVVCLGGVKQF
jgi:hypothetical protein